MKHQLLRLALAAPLLLLCGWPRTSIAQAAMADSVLIWGNNALTTVPVAAQSGVTAIAAGYNYTVALKNDGSVVLWGNSYQQSTVPVEAQTGVTAIAAGYYCTVALKNDGAVVAWGSNAYGQLRVPLAAQSGVTAIAAGWGHTVALKNDGTVVAWGDNGFGQTTVPVAAQNGVAAIAAGSWHTVALVTPKAPNIMTQPVGQAVNEWRSASFSVVATGHPLNYQWRKDGVDIAGATSATYSLPFAQTNQAGSYTVVVSNLLGSVTSAPPAVLTVTPAAAGAVVAWGNIFSYGQTTVPVAAQSGVTAIAAGGGHTVALKNDGTVVAWGYNGNGEVAGTPSPETPDNAIEGSVTPGGQVLSGVTAIAAVGSCFYGCSGYTVALKNDGTVVAWGYNNFGQTDVPVAAQSGVTAIAAGNDHIVALKDDGTVVAWGWNCFGQVTGTPTTGATPDASCYAIASPVTLGGQVLSGVMAIAAGGSHTVALKNDGTAVAWGYNRSGQVTGTAMVAPDNAIASPVTLGGQILSGVTAIAAGESHTVALKNDGTMVAWGGTGLGDINPVTLGDQVLSGVTAIAAGGSQTMALKNDGTVVAWGGRGLGEANPVTLGGQVLSGVTAIAAGPYHGVALIGGVQLRPSLKARPNGNALILSWPTNAAGFTLQSTRNLTPPVTWTDSTIIPAAIGAHFTLTNTTTGTQFYRLRKM